MPVGVCEFDSHLPHKRDDRQGRLFFNVRRPEMTVLWPFEGFGRPIPVQCPDQYGYFRPFRSYRSCRWVCTGMSVTQLKSYKSDLCRQSFAERCFDVQVSKKSADFRPILQDLSRKLWSEVHPHVQTRLVHHGIGPAGQIRLEETGLDVSG